MNLRAKILSGNLAIAALAVGLSVVIAASAVSDLHRQDAAARSLKAFELCLQIGGVLAVERTAWSGAMDSEEGLAGERASAVDKAVAAMDATLAAASQAVREAGLPAGPLEQAIAQFGTSRAQIRQALQKPKAARPAEAMADLVDGMARATGFVDAAIDGAFRSTTAMGPNLSGAIGLARLAQDSRNVNGSRSAVLGLFVRGLNFPPDRLTAVSELTGKVDLLWQLQVQAVNNLGNPPKLAAALDHVRTTVMSEGEQRYRAIGEAARTGRPCPVSDDEWRRWTTPMLANGLVMRDAAVETAHDINDAAIRNAWYRLGSALAVVLAVGVVAGGVVLVLLRQVIQRLGRLTTAIVRLADQDLEVDIERSPRSDEVEAMAAALVVLRDNARQARRQAEEARQAQEQRLARAERLAAEVKAFETAASRILGAVTEQVDAMCGTTQELAAGASTTVEDANQAASAANHVGMDVQALAGTAVELSASIGEIAGRISEAADQSRLAAESASRGSREFSRLTDYAAKIGDVVDLIQAIAGQTNLLALNATIEAARAGEAGQGFSVVAGEVKALAVRTTQATKTVSEQIEAIRKVSSEAVKAMDEIDGSVARISALAGSVAASVEQQHAATEEISRRVQMAADGAEQGAALAGRLATVANDAQSGAEEVRLSSQDTSAKVRQFRDEVTGFLTQVAALS